MFDTAHEPALVVVGTPSLLRDGIAAIATELGYPTRVTDAAALPVPAGVLLFMSRADLLRQRRAAAFHGSKVIVFAEPEPIPGVTIDGFLPPQAGRAQLDALLRCLLAPPPTSGVALSPVERRIVAGYVSGLTRSQLAETNFLAQCTVATHLQRARDKYRNAGRAAGSKIDLLKRAVEDGIVECPCSGKHDDRKCEGREPA
ncbi:helix-turn-helix transcriptional regulator [Rhodococcus pyridinivorans]|uniref:helix-turn-helix transcriptional regulator n=1 Tax=Rhodococcus pyridinivorans TaxID=103816 RepID=UPI002078BF07|nr:hypothetical protein [Rhodococcus pyridinivorans]USI89660.1 hypothetical protein LLA01_19135 [Rhodococcus pyridinivorans]